MTPVRIQRQRAKGWRMPAGAIYVGRPTRWGNPFPLHGPWIRAACTAYGYAPTALWRRALSVALYRRWLTFDPILRADMTYEPQPVELMEGRIGGSAWIRGKRAELLDLPLRPDVAPLRGHDLACWCPLDQPCHADVLLELANARAAIKEEEPAQ